MACGPAGDGDRYGPYRSWLSSPLEVLPLARHARQNLMVQDISTGVRDDLQKASELARCMVTVLGMSELLCPYTREEHKREGQNIEQHIEKY